MPSRHITVFEDRVDDFMSRIVLLDVLLGVGHAILRRELPAVDVTFIWEECKNLMVHYRVLGLHQFAGLLITDMARGLVMPEHPACAFHEGIPFAPRRGAAVYRRQELLIANQYTLVLVHKFSHVTARRVRDCPLPDDGHR